jgi:hypothetical protein
MQIRSEIQFVEANKDVLRERGSQLKAKRHIQAKVGTK